MSKWTIAHVAAMATEGHRPSPHKAGIRRKVVTAFWFGAFFGYFIGYILGSLPIKNGG